MTLTDRHLHDHLSYFMSEMNVPGSLLFRYFSNFIPNSGLRLTNRNLA